MNCKSCGRPLREGARFCTSCGEVNDAFVTPSTPTAAPARPAASPSTSYGAPRTVTSGNRTYKVVPAPSMANGRPENVANSYQNIINSMAAQGYRFVGSQNVQSSHKGCIGKAELYSICLLVFER